MQQLPPGFVLDPAPQAGPQVRGIPGTGPKPPSPIEVERLGLARDAGARADRAAELAERRFAYDQQQDAIKANPAKAAGPNPERAQQIKTILENLSRARELARQPFATGNLAGLEYFRNVPIIGQNAADLAGALEMAQGDLIQQARAEMLERGVNIGARGADTEKEAQRLAASKANLTQSQSYDEFLTGLERAEQYYARALAREMGLDPEDPSVQQQLGIKSDALPRALPKVEIPPTETQIDTEKRTLTNKKWDEVDGPKVGAMIARGLPLDNIRLFMSQNGYEVGNVAEIIKMRDDPNSAVSRWIKQNPGKPYPVSPIIEGEEELSGLDKIRAKAAGGEVAGFSPGAAVASGLDAASFGGSTEVAGLIGLLTGDGYGDARAEHVRKQQALSNENPGSSLAGGFLGGLATIPLMGAPASIGGVMKQGAGYGFTHGVLSSEDPSLGGRLQSGLTEAAVGTAAPLVLDPALRTVTRGGTGLERMVRRLTGADPEDIAAEAATETLANNLPDQDIGLARTRLAQQEALGINPPAAAVMDRSGVDYLGRLTQASPQARQAADEAVATAERALPGQIADDFTSAIDAAVGDGGVSAFLRRPAREITEDIQELAGNEFEAAITPLYHEPVRMNDEILDVLSSEWAGPAIRDALRQPKVTPETKAILRALPRMLADAEAVMRPPSMQLGGAAAESVAQYQRAAREAMLSEIGLNVETLWRIRSAMTRKAGKMSEGAPERVALRDEANIIGDVMGEVYPEWADANQLYSSRMRAIDALDDARGSFLSDTDALAKTTGRASGERVAPLPSERELAMAGAREAASDAAGKTTRSSGVTTGVNLSSANQRERNRMVFGDASDAIEQRTTARAGNAETLRQVRSGATGDNSETRRQAGMQAAADVGRGWPIAGMVAALRGIRGIDNDEAGRIVKLYTEQGKAGELLTQLERQFGKRKARFIMGRLGTIASSNEMGRAKPED